MAKKKVRKSGLMREVEKNIGEPVEVFLRREYTENLRAAPDIAEELGVGRSSIIYWMNKFGIHVRSFSEASSLAKSPGNFKSAELRRAEKIVGEPIDVFLRREYEHNQRPATELARELRVNQATVYTWLRNREIPIRAKSEAQSLAKLPEGFRKPTKRQFERWYLDRRMSTYEIGQMLDIADTTVIRLMDDVGIERRDFSECQLSKGSVRPTKAQLRQWYTNERLSSTEIAARLKVTNTTVLGWLRKHKIPTRNNSEAQMRGNARKPTKRQLKRMYHDERIPTGEIAEQLGVTPRTVMNWMIDYEIPIRSVRESKMPEGVTRPSEEELERMYVDEGMSTVQMAKRIGVRSSSTVGRWLKEHGIKRERPSNEELRELYHEEGLNAIEVGDKCGVTSTQVYYWMKKYGIPRRDLSESKLAKGARKPSKEELEEMWKNDTVKNIAEELGVNTNTVRNWVNEYQIPLKRRTRGEGRIRTPKQLETFLEETPQASELGSLVTVTENIGDVAEIFVQLWPERFPSAADLARSLPSAVRKIGYSLHPFSMEKARGLYDRLKATSGELEYALGDILFQIAVDQYQQQFNKDPQGTLAELSEHAKARNGFGKLVGRVARHYREVAKFSIPGFGKMKGVA